LFGWKSRNPTQRVHMMVLRAVEPPISFLRNVRIPNFGRIDWQAEILTPSGVLRDRFASPGGRSSPCLVCTLMVLRAVDPRLPLLWKVRMTGKGGALGTHPCIFNLRYVRKA